jgi:predicted DNA-binding protein (MmcQ/YjbR family)
MTLDDYNEFCATLPATTSVVQWGGSHVWKVGPKMFAIFSFPTIGGTGITFKTSPMSYELLKQQKGCRPAPYLAARGMTWIQCVSNESLSDNDVKLYIAESRRLVFETLPKKTKLNLTADTFLPAHEL